jgi:Fe-S-cluster containining protein
MSGRALPVLNFAPFRQYPAKQALQQYDDERQVCSNCLSGACCTTEDPIYLTSFDVFRLAAFFDLTPAQFLVTFTQDRFDGEDSDLTRRPWIDDPNSSKVTYLRRRANTPTSPCIFLKYIREPDGTPRRVCSVHDARPLSCREFYFHHCKLRITGELASLLAEGFEMARDGQITEQMVDEQLARFGQHDYSSARLAESMSYNFWVEMKRVLNMEQANIEGAKSYRAAEYQDPIDEKLNRVLSAKYLRFEEDYGPEPNNEQLMPYTTGLRFVASPEYQRIMKLVRTRPSSKLFDLGEYPFRVGLRTMMPGVKQAELFKSIPGAETKAFLRTIPATQLFPSHARPEVRAITLRELYASILKGFNHLIRFSSYLAVMGNMVEEGQPWLLETNLLEMLASFETSSNPYIARNPYLQPVKRYLAGVALELLAECLSDAGKPEDDFNVHRLLTRLWPVVPSLPPELRKRFEALAITVRERLQRSNLELYVRPDNPVEARRLQGKRLNSSRAWEEWERQALDMRYAAAAGFKRLKLAEYYRRSIDELERLPFRESYGLELYLVVVSLARSMSFDNRIARTEMPYQRAAEQLASYGARLFKQMDEVWGDENVDLPLLAEFSSSIYKGLGVGYDADQNFGLIVHRVLSSQLPDGSWGTNPLPSDAKEAQEDHLYQMYYTTCACIDALRVMRGDMLNAENRRLGLV